MSDDDKPGRERITAVSLPAFGLAKDILRRMETPATALPGSDAPLAPPSVTPPPLPTVTRTSTQGRDSLLQFADAVMTWAEAPKGAPVEAQHQLITFRLDSVEYGLPISRTREVVRVGAITRIPESPPYVRGVFNLRGRIVPVIDIRPRLGWPPQEPTVRSRLILVDAHGRTLALLVDAIAQIARVGASALKPPPPEVLSAHTDYVTAVAQVGERLIVLLDLDRLVLVTPPAAAAAGSTAPAARAPETSSPG